LTEEDWLQGLDLLNAWKMDFYYNLDMMVALLDDNMDGEVAEEEMEAVMPELCDFWKERAGITDGR
jgi:hypothetical protein